MTCEMQFEENQWETKRSFTSKLVNVKPAELRSKAFGFQIIYDCMKHIMHSLHYFTIPINKLLKYMAYISLFSIPSAFDMPLFPLAQLTWVAINITSMQGCKSRGTSLNWRLPKCCRASPQRFDAAPLSCLGLVVNASASMLWPWPDLLPCLRHQELAVK